MASFSSTEKKAIAGLSAVIALRMLGLSMIIPVFSVYALGLPGSSAFLAGLAFGIYGFTQALFQIPFGYMSDRLGRKKVVAFGLVLFGVGSLICAYTSDIYILIAGRILQGGGAIASACFAWVADLTDPSHRNRAMAFLGISVGGSIVMGMIVGPIISGKTGAAFLFSLAAILSLAAFTLTLLLTEADGQGHRHKEFTTLNPVEIMRLAAVPGLMRLYVAGFVVNVAMISTFLVVPIRLATHFETSELWQVYLPLSVLGAFAMMSTARKADAGGAKKVIGLAVFALVPAFIILSSGEGIQATLAGFGLFFAAFSVLEATLPSAVSKLADPSHKGAIIGVFNFSVFMGTFFGGVFAGTVLEYSQSAIFVVLAALVLMVSILILAGGSLEKS